MPGGERIVTIGLRKDRLKNEPTTGNIRCRIMRHLIFRLHDEGLFPETAVRRPKAGPSGTAGRISRAWRVRGTLPEG